MTQTIEIVVAPSGQSRVATKGFTGRSCQEASRFIEQALGQTQEENLTAEFYAQVSTQDSVHQQT